MSESGTDADTSGGKKLSDGLRSSRESLKNLGEKSRLLQEQLLRLEKKLWGRMPEETVKS